MSDTLNALLPEVFSALKETCKVDKLPGDASNRSYIRLHRSSGETLIVMIMNAPEAFKSEEKTGSTEKPRELPFISVGRAFEKAGIRVPRILYADPRERFLVLDDLGDELLYARADGPDRLMWYRKALDELARIQSLQAFSPVSDNRFTQELLDWEAEHFVEYALLKRQKHLSATELSELRSFLKSAVVKLIKTPYVVTHRDYHSKNLMILKNENRVGVIDFQDALMGPDTYDLASLLRDSYVRLSEDEENDLLHYFEQISRRSVDLEAYALQSLQRNLKAVGRFYYISMVKGRDTHLPYVKPTLHRVFKTLEDLKARNILNLLQKVLRDEAS